MKKDYIIICAWLIQILFSQAYGNDSPKFIWPVQLAGGNSYFDCYSINNYVDQDPTVGSLLDYNCQSKTYDGHNGTDFDAWPFHWMLHDSNWVEIIAAAPGTITAKQDGYDARCHPNPVGGTNYVYVQHDDGSVARYLHLKKNTLTSKAVGESVAQGEYIGIMGSSGNSSHPHLHFEVRDANNAVIDPFAGSCNSMNSESWWQSQPDYNETGLNALMTHHTTPVMGYFCPEDEITNISNTFYPGDPIFVAAYFRARIGGDVATFRVVDPHGNVWSDWQHTLDGSGLKRRDFRHWLWYLPESGPFGNWRFECDYNGQTFVHTFQYKNSNASITELIWPLRLAGGKGFFSGYAINNYVDQNPATSMILDYNCQSKSYDGHNGTDFDAWPFHWMLHDSNWVEIIAAAPGTITAKQDGYDARCHPNPVGGTNYVYVQHDDGSVARYVHLKKNTLTSKAVGESVAQGEYIGIMGSSGNSSHPHLHFEVRNANNVVVDPFAGSCNYLNTESWWQSQPDYMETGLNALLTHNDYPQLGYFCPEDESANISNYFDPGDPIYFYAYYRATHVGDLLAYRIKDPSGNVWNQWSFDEHGDYFKRVAGPWIYYLPEEGPFGTWTFESDYNGQTFAHTFQYGSSGECPESIVVSENPAHLDVFSAVNSVVTQGTVIVNSGVEATFKAGNSVRLNMGFSAKTGSLFSARLEDCEAAVPPASPELKATEDTYAGLDENGQVSEDGEWDAAIYPNPTEGLLTIEGANEAEVTVIDGVGKLCLQQKLTNNTVDISELERGVYFLFIKEGEQVAKRKVIKY